MKVRTAKFIGFTGSHFNEGIFLALTLSGAISVQYKSMNNTESSGVESLKIYYGASRLIISIILFNLDRLFPYESMIKWLSYGAGKLKFGLLDFVIWFRDATF